MKKPLAKQNVHVNMKVSFEKQFYIISKFIFIIVIIQTIPHTAMEKSPNRILTGGYFYAGIFSKKKRKRGPFYADLLCNDSGKGVIFKERICAAGPGVESGKSVRQDEGSELGWRELLFVLAG